MPIYYVVTRDTGVLYYDRGFATLFEVMEHFITINECGEDEVNDFIENGVESFCNLFLPSINLLVSTSIGEEQCSD